MNNLRLLLFTVLPRLGNILLQDATKTMMGSWGDTETWRRWDALTRGVGDAVTRGQGDAESLFDQQLTRLKPPFSLPPAPCTLHPASTS
ncbi:hypothetical protein [Trichormus variabilis]|uniref:hypothetical protein n=1 Tax=Anabaena variabilis TaxID=264691 RepID=UPI000F8DB197|nr:hypothetical protein [Trichormus variabilis]MBD2626810.1 hypothetical protein [Trichormus variabilis FACHB-164]